MKKVLALLVGLCLATVALPGVAAAEEVSVSPERAQLLCEAFFDEDRCEDPAGWIQIATGRADAADIEALADRLTSGVRQHSRRSFECEMIFSDEVCAQVRGAVAAVKEAAGDPIGTVNEIRQWVVLLLQELKYQILCTLDPSQCARSSLGSGSGSSVAAASDAVVCREVFSDAVCDIVENPVPLIVALVTFVLDQVICLINPTCSPIDRFLCQIIEPCSRLAAPAPALRH